MKRANLFTLAAVISFSALMIFAALKKGGKPYRGIQAPKQPDWCAVAIDSASKWGRPVSACSCDYVSVPMGDVFGGFRSVMQCTLATGCDLIAVRCREGAPPSCQLWVGQ